MNSRFLRSLQLYLGFLDFIVLNAVFFIVQFFFESQSLITNDIAYAHLGFFMSAAWICTILLTNLYHEKYVSSFEAFTKMTIRAYLYFLLLVIMYLFFFRIMDLSRVFLTVVLVNIPIALLVNRFLYLGIVQYLKKQDFLIKVAVIGYNSLSKKLVNYLEEDTIKKEVVGFCEEPENVHELSAYPIISNIERTIETCKAHGITEIYSTIAPEHNEAIYNLMQTADENCIRFKIVPDLEIYMKKKMHIDYLKEIPVIMMRKEPLEEVGNRVKKRLFDILVSSLVIIFILSWLLPIISLLIWLESKGPIFFIQERTGKDNRVFRCLKFRSMKVNEHANLVQATANDSRITRMGKFMRRTNIDEFPQFLNVFRGQMSIVGPRPHMLRHTDEYSKLIGQYMVRQFLKPGITGWAQVNGFRGETRNLAQMQHRVEHDLWYMEQWSLVLDLRIMFMTVFNAIKGEENAR
ncbi:undecaprenyl-phosphate glucose phosphotransferase [Segetibacter sp. 3557_3]|uniref:undecaprenyl-phosphate glucose phosphotransferase n=1 Tax=Segetibacter sp. 3557_3 TaxID=2547429 RepID=UPI001058A7D0|nr:undecaprenyl-phosphate glucose phosphotransferase [Segetibacter sp. 3557_3]TDH20696.1 undecaprenyl-phosphate glucose phosphotransferase [Segetibacter sp. 3557_3]